VLNGAGVQWVDPVEYPVAGRGQVDPIQRCVNPEAPSVGHRPGRVGGHHQHLRGNAPAIETRPTETIRLDNCRPEMVELRSRHHVAATGTPLYSP
jgi:hypothetical protein